MQNQYLCLNKQYTYSLKECNNDTLEYIKENFTGKKIDKYINQPFGKFVDDFELSICLRGMSCEINQTPREMQAIKISYWDFYGEYKSPIYCCFIRFYKPYPTLSGFSKYSQENRLLMAETTREYFYDYIIEDMEFILFDSNKAIRKQEKFLYWKGLEFDD